MLFTARLGTRETSTLCFLFLFFLIQGFCLFCFVLAFSCTWKVFWSLLSGHLCGFFQCSGSPRDSGIGSGELTLGFPPVLQRKQTSSHIC